MATSSLLKDLLAAHTNLMLLPSRYPDLSTDKWYKKAKSTVEDAIQELAKAEAIIAKESGVEEDPLS